VLLLTWLLTAPAQAQTPPSPADLPALEQFLDQTISVQLDELTIPGAAVAVVVDGQLLLVKGYGLADQEQYRPVEGERTLFRTGSAAKPITWTAVMQLVEGGRLDLHADVNQYLDFTIPATFAEPITLAHLMTHTPGFEDVGEALFVLSPEKMMSLRQYLTELLPARVFPPGTVQAYSNYGTALAGYIVERVAGEPFADYVENHIFAPLEMNRSTLRQPVPPELAGDLAVGYGTGEYRYLRGGFIYMPPYPAGSMSTTVADMGRFLIAHLQDGRYGETTILQPATVQEMHRRQFTPDPRLDGMGYGFMLQQVNGHDVVFHRGSAFQFNAGLYLLPAENVGLYVVYNGLGALEAPAQLWQAFMDRFYPAPPPEPLLPPPDTAGGLAAYTGEYHLARADFSGPAKVFRLLEAAQVGASPDGFLQLTVEGRTQQYAAVEPGLFRHRERDEYLAFHTGADGVQWLSLDGRPAFLNFTATSAFQAPWYATLPVSVLLILLTLLIFLMSSLGWLIGALWARKEGEQRPLALRLARWLAVAFGLCFLAFLVAFISVVADIDPAFGVPRIFFGESSNVEVVLLLPWLLTLLAVALVIGVGWVWWKASRRQGQPIGLWSRLQLAGLSILALSAVWWLAYWNLLA
jgi:CubicO group peptidase (beta-lactamase class C family)